MQNKRDFFRLDFLGFFYYKRLALGDYRIKTDEQFTKSRILNISGGGLACFTPALGEPLHPRSCLYGEIVLTQASRIIPVMAHIIRQTIQPFDDQEGMILAVKFVEIEIIDQDLIVEIINRNVIPRQD